MTPAPLTDTDIHRIAAAVCDEQERRARATAAEAPAKLEVLAAAPVTDPEKHEIYTALRWLVRHNSSNAPTLFKLETIVKAVGLEREIDVWRWSR